MHITSDHYRRGVNHGFADEGLAGCWSRIVRKVALAAQQAEANDQAKPLEPSGQTLKQLKNHYNKQHHIHS
jgi:hypothetical protein